MSNKPHIPIAPPFILVQDRISELIEIFKEIIQHLLPGSVLLISTIIKPTSPVIGMRVPIDYSDYIFEWINQHAFIGFNVVIPLLEAHFPLFTPQGCVTFRIMHQMTPDSALELLLTLDPPVFKASIGKYAAIVL